MIAQQHTTKPGVIDCEDFTLAEGLRAYGYLLDPRRDPDCWLWLKGMIADDLLPHARDVIYKRYGMTYQPPRPQLVEKPRQQAKAANTRKPSKTAPRQRQQQRRAA